MLSEHIVGKHCKGGSEQHECKMCAEELTGRLSSALGFIQYDPVKTGPDLRKNREASEVKEMSKLICQ